MAGYRSLGGEQLHSMQLFCIVEFFCYYHYFLFMFCHPINLVFSLPPNSPPCPIEGGEERESARLMFRGWVKPQQYGRMKRSDFL